MSGTAKDPVSVIDVGFNSNTGAANDRPISAPMSR
jgi:hypothetical protein